MVFSLRMRGCLPGRRCGVHFRGVHSARGLRAIAALPRTCNAAVVTIGIDPGKNTLHLVGLDVRGGIVLREKVARARIVSRLANVAPCLIGIEAGAGTRYVTRELLALGHDVRQVPPVYAKPFRQTHKNDFRDAHAIAEAVRLRKKLNAMRASASGLPASRQMKKPERRLSKWRANG